MEILEISKTIRQADSKVVAALIASVQAAGAFGRRVLPIGARMGREKRPGSALIERVSAAHPFFVDARP